MKRVNVKFPGRSSSLCYIVPDSVNAFGASVKPEGGMLAGKVGTTNGLSSFKGKAYTAEAVEPINHLFGCPVVMLEGRDQIPVPMIPIDIENGIIQIPMDQAMDALRESQMRMCGPARWVSEIGQDDLHAPRVAFHCADSRTNLRLDVEIEKGRLTACRVVGPDGVCYGQIQATDLTLDGDIAGASKISVSTRRFKIDGEGAHL